MNVNWKILTVIIVIVLVGALIWAWRSQSFKVEEIRQLGGEGGAVILVR
ncbi:MAG: hypothetical protein V2G42_08075 [bacterium JZ-2024 1]